MSLPSNFAVSVEQIRAAAALVALPLTPMEEVAAATFLSEWIPAAGELNNRIQSSDHDSIMPITVYSVPSDIMNDFS